MKFDKMPEGILNAISNATGMINFTAFHITPEIFKDILKACKPSSSIHFLGGKAISFPDNFEFDPKAKDQPKIIFER